MVPYQNIISINTRCHIKSLYWFTHGAISNQYIEKHTVQYQASYWFSHGAILIILLISTRFHIKHYVDFHTVPYQSLCYKTPTLLKPYCNIDLYILHPDAEKANGESSWRAILLPAEICWVNTHKPGCI